jgi:regulatory protein
VPADREERLAHARKLLSERLSEAASSDEATARSVASKKRRSKKGRRVSFVEGASPAKGALSGEDDDLLSASEDEADEEVERRPSHQPDPNKISEAALHEAALRYLDRQDASVQRVRQTLIRRLARYGDDETRPVARAHIESVLERLLDSRVLDDERYALNLAEGLRRRGASIPVLRQKLAQRGLSLDQIDQAVDEIEEDDSLSDDKSAAEYARKRRLTSRYNLDDPRERQKALAALARQGFSFDVARRALGL